MSVKLDFQRNIGKVDRVSRILLGLSMMGANYLTRLSRFWGAVIPTLGLIFVVEGLASYCFLYDVLGWSTRKESRQRI